MKNMKIEIFVSIKTLRCVSIVCLIGILALLSTTGARWWKTRDYVKTTGIVSDITRELSYTSGTDNYSVYHYVHCEYIVSGEEYECEYRAVFWVFIKIGDQKTIYYDSSNPAIVRDRDTTRVSLFLCGFLLGVFLFTVAAIKQNSKQQ